MSPTAGATISENLPSIAFRAPTGTGSPFRYTLILRGSKAIAPEPTPSVIGLKVT
jgi:hypothetical protein